MSSAPDVSEPGVSISAVEWPQLRHAIIEGRVQDVVDLLSPVPADDLKHLHKDLKALHKELRTALRDAVRDQTVSTARFQRPGRLLLAAVMCAPTPAEAALWIRRFDLVWSLREQACDTDAAAALAEAMIGRRDRVWLAELAVRLADGLSARNVDWILYELTTTLAQHSGATLPLSDGYVIAWLSGVDRFNRGEPRLAAILRGEPRLREITPRLFEVPDVGNFISARAWRQTEQAWINALVELTEDGTLDRATVLDLCVGKLLRGDSVGNMRGFHALHDALAPRPDEISAHCQSYVGMAFTGQAPTVKRAQAALKALDAHKPLEASTLAELSSAVFARPEASLAATQLMWIDTAVKRSPTDAHELLSTLAVAFGHPATATQERALRLVAKYIRQTEQKRQQPGKGSAFIDGPLLAELREAAATLDPALTDEARQVFGTGSDAVEDDAVESAAPIDEPPPIPLPAYEPSSGPTPIASLEELVEAAAPAYAQRNVDATTAELIMAALAEYAHRDRAALVAAFEPLAARYPRDQWFAWTQQQICGALRSACDAARGVPSGATGALHKLVGSAPRASKAFYLRVYELAEALAADVPLPCLLATPTEANGAVAPAAFLDRLARHRAVGVEPLPCDLEQALLRLPPEPGPEVRSALAALPPLPGPLPSFAGIYTPDERGEVGFDAYRWPLRLAIRSAAAQSKRPETAPPLSPYRALAPDRGFGDSYGEGGWVLAADDWPALLPYAPEVIAAHVIPELYEQVHGTAQGPSILPRLAETSGTPGPVTHLALVYGLSARDPQHRVAAVDALLILAARGLLDPAVLGTHIGRTLRRDMVKIKRVAEALNDAAHAGARREVLGVAAAAVTELAAAPGTRGLPDLLLLATRYAESAAAEARPEFPRLAELAARAKPPRVAQEAKRLQRALGRT